MTKLFIDTNIILDLLAKRNEFLPAAELFTLADRGKVKLYVSALTFANANFILNRQHKEVNTLKVLRDLELLVTITDLNGKITRLALNDDDFNDFEDGLQYYSAIENSAEIIITRNLPDFKNSKIPVLTADQYLKSKM